MVRHLGLDTELTGYEKTILSDLQGAWQCLRRERTEHSFFDAWLADVIPRTDDDKVSVERAKEMIEASEKDIGTEDSLFLRVECYAGHRADSEPQRLHVGQREVAVTEIIDRWLNPRHRCFKLRGDDGGIYLLRQDTIEDRWEMILYDSGRREETRLSST